MCACIHCLVTYKPQLHVAVSLKCHNEQGGLASDSTFACVCSNATEMKKTLETYERKISELAMHQRSLSEVLDSVSRLVL